MTRRILLITLSSALGLFACDEGETDQSAPTETASPGESAAAGPQEVAPGASAADPNAAGGPGQPGMNDQMVKQQLEMMKKQQEMRSKALAAAENAEAKGDSSCEKAFHAAVAGSESMRAQLGKQAPPSQPNEGAFVSTCQELPKPVRQCLVPSYANGNDEECAKAHQSAGPEVKAKMQELMAQLQ